MKNFLVFFISVLALFIIIQVLSGYFMTLFYTPDITSAWNQSGSLSSSVTIKGSSSLFIFLLALLTGTIAYFSLRYWNKSNN